MKKIKYLLLASCICWVAGWTLLTSQLDNKKESSPTELTTEKAPTKELTSIQ